MNLSVNAPAKQADRVLHGSSILAAIKAAGIQYVLAVPDITTSRGLLYPIAKDPAFRLVRVCKEDECLGIAAGLSYGNKRALILIQHTGMYYAMNAIRAVGVELGHPICMMVGLLSKEPDTPPRESKRYGVRIAEPMLDVMGIVHHYIDTDEDVAKIGPAVADCYEHSHPVAMLIGRRPS